MRQSPTLEEMGGVMGVVSDEKWIGVMSDVTSGKGQWVWLMERVKGMGGEMGVVNSEKWRGSAMK